MADARTRDNWAHTSTLLAHMANMNRASRRSRVFKPSDFDPFAARRRGGVPMTKENLRALKEAFVDRKRKDGGP